MRNVVLFATCLLLAALSSCSDKKDEPAPPFMGTAEYDSEVVYFISSHYLKEVPRWKTGVRITLEGYNTLRYPSLLGGEYTVDIAIPPTGDAEVVATYENADIGELRSLVIHVAEKNIFYTKDLELFTLPTPEAKNFEIESGTFSWRPVHGEETYIMLSLNLNLSDGKTFSGSATVPQKVTFRPVKH